MMDLVKILSDLVRSPTSGISGCVSSEVSLLGLQMAHLLAASSHGVFVRVHPWCVSVCPKFLLKMPVRLA